MTKIHCIFNKMLFILSFLTVITTNVSAASLSSDLNSQTLVKDKNFINKFMPVYQGKCDRNPKLPGC